MRTFNLYDYLGYISRHDYSTFCSYLIGFHFDVGWAIVIHVIRPIWLEKIHKLDMELINMVYWPQKSTSMSMCNHEWEFVAAICMWTHFRCRTRRQQSPTPNTIPYNTAPPYWPLQYRSFPPIFMLLFSNSINFNLKCFPFLSLVLLCKEAFCIFTIPTKWFHCLVFR